MTEETNGTPVTDVDTEPVSTTEVVREDELREELRKFTIGIGSSSVKSHVQSSSALIRVLDRVQDLNEAYFKGLMRISVSSAVKKFMHAQSFQAIEKLIDSLASNNCALSVRHLSHSIVALFPPITNLSPSTSSRAIVPNKWLCKHVKKDLTEDDISLLVSALASLAFYATASKPAEKAFKRNLKKVVQVLSVETLTNVVKKFCAEPTNAYRAIALISFIDQLHSGSELSSSFADVYSKNILLGKSIAPSYLLSHASYSIAKVTDAVFKETFLSNIKKSLLRSPEIALFGVSAFLKECTIPLDGYVPEIMKSVEGSFISSDESVRELAVSVAAFLAINSEPPACGKVVDSLFTNANAAKSSDIRVSLLNGIARCASTKCVTGDALDIVANDVITKALKGGETHDATVSAQWNCVVEWSKRLSKQTVPLENAFKDAPKAPATVKHLAYHGLSDVLTARSMTQLPASAEKTLWAEVDGSQKEATDTICLASLLLQTSQVGSEQQVALWKKLTSNENIFRDKSLSSITHSIAVQWASVVERLILDRPTDSSYPLSAVRSLGFLLFWPNYLVRQRATLALTRILTVEESNFAEYIAEIIYKDTVDGVIDQTLRKVCGGSVGVEWVVPGEWFVNAVQKMLTPTGPQLSSLAIHTLLLASLPRLVEVDGAVWLRWMHEQQQKKLADYTTSEQFIGEVIDRVLKCKERNVRDNALITLVALHIPSVRNHLWKHVEENLMELDTKEYNKVAEKDVAIFRTPEGKLYNTEVLEIDEGAEAKNMRRENKAYSYADQQAEIELRRELAEKMRKEGKLTPKQKQAMEKEMAKEKEVRDEVNELYVCAEVRLDETRAMVAADPQGAFSRPALLFDRCIPLTKSNLVAREAASLFLAYRNAAFPASDDYLHELVGHSTLRLVSSKWLCPIWCEEPLGNAVKRALSLLNEKAFVIDTGDDEEDDALLYEDTVGPSELLLLFPLLKAVIEGRHSDSIKDSALQFAQSAINKKFLRDGSVLQIPIVQYANLFLTFFSQTEDMTLRKSAVAALTNLVILVNDTNDTSERVVELVGNTLEYLTHEDATVRETVLKVLSANQLITRLVMSNPDSSFVPNCMVRLFVARFDSVEAVSNVASDLWLASLLHIKQIMLQGIVDECVSPFEFIRDSASKALVVYLEEFPDDMKITIDKIEEAYLNLYDVKGAQIDDMGRMQRDVVDEWPRRKGAAVTLGLLSSMVDETEAEHLIHVVVPKGLDDRVGPCRHAMQEAAVDAIKRHGRTIMPRLLPFLEELLDKTPEGKAHDNLRQGLVVLMGTLAQYIDPKSDKVKAIVARLMEALSTPSQSVQESVSKCLSPLVPAIREGAKDLIGKLQWLLFEADSYGERRGAAYGVAGLVKGMGMLSLKELDLLPTVMKSLEDKKNPKHREGALLALEIMCSTIGRLFEPYMVKALPLLLVCFGDGVDQVRKAAVDTARAMMTALTAHGTKVVLPSLLIALNNDTWRTKCAAAELLGSMAHCAPKQLSACLPNIVPKLIEGLADSHPKVQKSCENALGDIAKVIRNPEILGVVDKIMLGLIDPAKNTNFSLQSVLNTKFIHYIDAPSLALIMPVVNRAFSDRNSETRRFAAQITSNIYNLTEHKDMEPYLAPLVPGLQKCLMDSVPEIRSVAAKALGSVISKSEGTTSERLRETIIPWLKEKLISGTSTVDRSGAAQGLAEVLHGVGTEQLDYVMPEIIAATESTEVSPETRDGYILMYIYLPMVFGEKFVPYLPQVVPPILKALADENEYVRASSLKAGQRLIAQYCSHARRLLLPELQRALFDENWRIRHAAVQLIGDFLFNISGVSGKSTSDTATEDDTMGMEQAGKQIIRALGQKCRDEVLAGLYLTRSDVGLIVRQASSHVWKMVVSNTPRTVKEIMKTLFEMVVECLASSCEEKQQMGARCLGELVRKMGEKILNEILPVLEANQKSDDLSKRIGVAIALHEIIDNVTKDVLQHYLEQIVIPIRNALIDEAPSVREEAASTFSRFYANVGNDALDEIIAPLLDQLTPDQEAVLDGLCAVMRQNSKHMLPYLLPRLTRPPINVHALCSLAAVAGDSLSRQLPKVFDALLEACKTNDQYDPMIDACEKVVVAVTDEEGVPLLLDYFMQKANKENVPSAVLLHTFIEKTQVPLDDMVEDILPGLLQLYTSPKPQIVDHAIHALIAVVQSMDPRELMDVIPFVRKQINYLCVQSKGKGIAGFAHPKGLQPLVPMLREGILQGGVELKELAGETLGQVVSMSDPIALKAHVVNVTGPLIRVLGDRYPASVKLSILSTLCHLMDKVDVMLRPFLPQLQSTFVKALQEPNSRPVRLAAGGALRRLLKIHPKPEPLVAELWKVLAAQQDKSLMETTFVCARALISICAPKLSEGTIEEGFRVCALTYSTPLDTPTELDNNLTVVSGALLGELALHTDQIDKHSIFSDVESSSKPRVRLAKTIAMQQMCMTNAEKVWGEHESECRSSIQGALSGDSNVAQAALKVAGYILMSQGSSPNRELLTLVSRALNHQNVDVRKIVSVVLGHVLANGEQASQEVLKIVIPSLVNGSKEANTSVRCEAETALVHAFRLYNNKEVFDTYTQTEKGAAKDGLIDCYDRTLKRLVKNNEYTLEGMNNIMSVP